MAWVVTDHVFCNFFLLEDVVFDGPQFVSHFWREFCQQIGASTGLSSGFHPQVNGHTESANEALKWIFQCLASPNPSPWSQQLTYRVYPQLLAGARSCAAWVINLLCFLPRGLRLLFSRFWLLFSVVAIPGGGPGRLWSRPGNPEFITFTFYTLLSCPQ